MPGNKHIENVHRLAMRDGRYAADAFLFVSDAVQQTVRWLRDGELCAEDSIVTRGEEEEFHVSGRELLKGVRRLAQERWGLMALHMLHGWGIRRTEDIGEIVFLMVEDPEMHWRKRECDTRADFANGYNFDETFSKWED